MAHNCSVLRVPFDSVKLFTEPYGNYATALRIVVEAVAATNRHAAERADRG